MFYHNENDSENKFFSEKFTLIYIELNKFAARNKMPEFSDELQKWLYVMKNVSNMGEPEVSLQEGVFRKFFESCKYSKLDVMEKEDYRKSVLDYEDVQDAVSYAQERGMAEGVERGRLEGLREGREEGICEGRREGRQEKQMEIARTMLDCKFDISTIAKLTGLSEKEILVL
ncbi:MAG: PD-(D/E)XK nuclease family transposase [Bacteroidales bacterium]|nr:PD-(D/E)XK nuclease family transposase [Bacteroidales bacterium]